MCCFDDHFSVVVLPHQEGINLDSLVQTFVKQQCYPLIIATGKDVLQCVINVAGENPKITYELLLRSLKLIVHNIGGKKHLNYVTQYPNMILTHVKIINKLLKLLFTSFLKAKDEVQKPSDMDLKNWRSQLKAAVAEVTKSKSPYKDPISQNLEYVYDLLNPDIWQPKKHKDLCTAIEDLERYSQHSPTDSKQNEASMMVLFQTKLGNTERSIFLEHLVALSEEEGSCRGVLVALVSRVLKWAVSKNKKEVILMIVRACQTLCMYQNNNPGNFVFVFVCLFLF